MLLKLSFIIRKLTIPPVFAVLLLVTAFVARPDFFGSSAQLLLGIFFLSVLPTLAYPLQRFIPRFKDRGREGQRSLAMIFSAVGYLLGVTVSFAAGSPKELRMIYTVYLLCGVLMLILNKALTIKASGHACGIVGPALMLFYLRLYASAIVASVLCIPVFISSLKTKRHTLAQLIAGSLIPAFSIFTAHLIFA